MKHYLDRLLQLEIIHPLSYYFAQYIAEQSQQQMDSLLCLTAALISYRNQQGDMSVNLNDYANTDAFIEFADQLEQTYKFPDVEHWKHALTEHTCVGKANSKTALILEGDDVYLGKQWHFEDYIVQQIKQRLAQTIEVNSDTLKQGLNHFFPKQDDTIDWQKVAASVVVNKAFSVISGGPGTGKTTTIIKVIALLLEQSSHINIQLCAPTGKAAVRMLEAINSRKQALNISTDILNRMPSQAKTIHRLLGYQHGKFTHNQNNPLAVDCLIIDEASMIDAELMVHILKALTAKCRIILLGDKDQLSSVDAGHIFSDICGRGEHIIYNSAQNQQIAKLCDLEQNHLENKSNSPDISQAIGLLKRSYRFNQHSGIGRLAKLVNEGQGTAAVDLMQLNDEGLSLYRNQSEECSKQALELILSAYEKVVDAKTVEQAIHQFEQFQCLGAVKKGPFGVNALNELISQRLFLRKKIQTTHEFNGQPIIIIRNDLENNLFNGDVGILWRNQGQNLVYFKQIDGSLKSYPLISLSHYETAWVITVHKSQGSEYESVMMVLPNTAKGILKRELIYTGITRAKKQFYCSCEEHVFIQACVEKTKRSSRVAEKLGW